MIVAIVIGVLAVAALAYIVAPIGKVRALVDDDEPESEAEEKKRIALTGILDLEEERDAGKLSDPEFHDLRVRYEQEAVVALRELDEDPAPGLEDRLEREIAEARGRLRCKTCGAPRTGDAARCSSCGSPH